MTRLTRIWVDCASSRQTAPKSSTNRRYHKNRTIEVLSEASRFPVCALILMRDELQNWPDLALQEILSDPERSDQDYEGVSGPH